MTNVIDMVYLRAVAMIRAFAEELRDDERGVTNIVAAIILLMITIVLVAVFWQNIQELVSGWWDTINSNADKLPSE